MAKFPGLNPEVAFQIAQRDVEAELHHDND